MGRIGDERDGARRRQEGRLEQERRAAEERSRRDFHRVLEQRHAERGVVARSHQEHEVQDQRNELARRLAERLLERGKGQVQGVEERLRERARVLRRRSDEVRRRQPRRGQSRAATHDGITVDDDQAQDRGAGLGASTGESDHRGRGQAESARSAGRPSSRIDELRDALLRYVDEIIEDAVVRLTEKGAVEVEIELRAHVLAGCRLRLTAAGRDVFAVFVADDDDVRRLLKASEGPLARALARRSMRLGSLEVEAPA